MPRDMKNKENEFGEKSRSELINDYIIIASMHISFELELVMNDCIILSFYEGNKIGKMAR